MSQENKNPLRKKLILSILGVFALAGVAYWVWWEAIGNHFESTEDAYVQGNIVPVMPRIEGMVTKIYADDTNAVEAGQLLVQLDDTDAQLALEQAEANLGQVVRQLRNTTVTNDVLQAEVRARQADVNQLNAQLQRANEDLQRRRRLAESGAVSKEELTHAEKTAEAVMAQIKAAQAAVSSAQEQLKGNQALTKMDNVADHPSVITAAARVRDAYYRLQRTSIHSPASGVVAKRAVQVGQRVQPGSPLMSVIPLEQVWVDANFKETQLQHMRLGQPATVHVDLYGKDVAYQGRVAGFAAGTGGAFALIPAQNATGNWIKVVQRVPVRIELTGSELKEFPLRLGLSSSVTVDIKDQSGPLLTQPTPNQVATETDINQIDNTAINQRIAEIIQRNQ